ncbi:methyltransferase [Devosia pacifica]|uniref:Methyltransferase n=1 Tax=Devosia pacifica TaxID=1335967 RepID=A0A918VUL2_9HYPH|nr:methyltransferase [Devosia pacifica]GHA30381.1 methyltransferase [Devosia pacifica]
MSLDHAEDFVKRLEPTEDAFLGGRLAVLQPAKGFRAGLDSVLLGAAVGAGKGRLLDLGAGVGTASLVAMHHNSSLSALLAERDEAILPLTHKNLARNGFSTRAEAICVDVCARGRDRQAAGLEPDAFSRVIANPPFFDEAAGTRAGAARADARHMAAEALDLWVRAAATCAAAGGEIVFIYPAAGLVPLISAFDQRFGAICLLPLSPRPEADATRILVRARKGSRAPLRMLTPRYLHAREGRAFMPEFEAIFRGEARLDW